MTITEKRETKYKLSIYIAGFSSQKKAAESLEGVSEATIIGMLNESDGWNRISDAMWRNVASQVGGIVEFNKLVETQNFQTLTLYFEIAKEEGASFAIVGGAGWGKSYAAKWFSAVRRKDNVYYLECAEYWNKKMFLQKLMAQMGKSCYGMGTGELMENIVREMRRQKNPLIIIDEVDKLPDPVLKFFITLYNELNKTCGFIWLSTDAIKKRITKGIDKGTVGYQELYSRIGASFVALNIPTSDEVKEICVANSIKDQQTISIISNEVKELKGDLRRVDRNLLKNKVKSFRNTRKTAA